MPSIRRRLAVTAAAVLALGISGALAADAKPAAADAKVSGATAAYKEFMWGNPKAKVTVIEYASLTCPHCARFENDVFPEIKKNYTDTGKIRFVFRDYPLDGLAMAGAVLARCAPEDRGKKMIEIMFKNQLEWVRAPQPLEPLKQYAALSGLPAAEVDACLKNEALLKTIKDEQTKASTLYQVQSTPTFYVDDEKVEGEMTFESFAKILDKHLAKAK
jgi:protein-disulfide isomerase